MKSKDGAATGSFAAAEEFQMRMALKSTPAQRLQDLQDMLDFNAVAQARNPDLRAATNSLTKRLTKG
jgi:hypothetical protein